jgi:hypothetical protein
LPAKEELLSALHQSVRELRHGIDIHTCLIASLLEDKVEGNQPKPLWDLCRSMSREDRLKHAIREAIEVLEESRKSFKSKRLEALRKQLTQVLIDSQ